MVFYYGKIAESSKKDILGLLGYPSSPGKVVKTSPVKQNQRISLTIKYDNKKTNSGELVFVDIVLSISNYI